MIKEKEVKAIEKQIQQEGFLRSLGSVVDQNGDFLGLVIFRTSVDFQSNHSFKKSVPKRKRGKRILRGKPLKSRVVYAKESGVNESELVGANTKIQRKKRRPVSKLVDCKTT